MADVVAILAMGLQYAIIISIIDLYLGRALPLWIVLLVFIVLTSVAIVVWYKKKSSEKMEEWRRLTVRISIDAQRLGLSAEQAANQIARARQRRRLSGSGDRFDERWSGQVLAEYEELVGLTAVVYKNKDHLTLGSSDEEVAQVIPETDEVYFERDDVSRKYLQRRHARERRLDNIAAITQLREEISGNQPTGWAGKLYSS